MRLPFNGNYRVTQKFGVNPQDYAKFGMKGHNGIDYGLPLGTPVVAATSGTVSLLLDPPGFGNYIQLQGSEYRTIYAHLQKFAVSNGQKVSEGQLIGYSNNTGNSSGPHLHFGVKPLNPNKSNGFLGAIDPQPILDKGTSPGGQDMRNTTDKEARDIYFITQGHELNQEELDHFKSLPLDEFIAAMTPPNPGYIKTAKITQDAINSPTYKEYEGTLYEKVEK